MSEGHAAVDMALSDIRVVDFGVGVIDPLATSYLADFGAEVIKVESSTRMDFIRGTEYFVDATRDPDRNANFGRFNQNKIGVLINLKHPQGVALAKKLVSVADIVSESYAVGVIQRLGLGYEELRKVKPDIIMLSSSFAGQTGPYRDFRGQGNVIAALQGLDELTGWPDRRLVSPGAAFCDLYLPWMWVTVILAALEYRRRTGRGQFIDGSCLEAGLDILDTAIADYAVNGRALSRRGNAHPCAAPHGVYRCLGDDAWCAITVFTDGEWTSFCEVLGSPAWTKDERFSTLLVRQQNVAELDRLIEEWTTTWKADELMLVLQEAGVAAGVVKNAREMYEDPQLAQRGHFWEPAEPGMEAYTFEAPSATLSRTPARFQRRAPFLGEHNDYVFLDLLGLEPLEYARLIDEGVIA
ncbi:MAG: CoA transferase [Chloroflexi bacterium]|nr:CoA transferase [Chloroflexota bacterium]